MCVCVCVCVLVCVFGFVCMSDVCIKLWMDADVCALVCVCVGERGSLADDSLQEVQLPL